MWPSFGRSKRRIGLRGDRGRKAKSVGRLRHRRAALEPLEERQLLAVSILEDAYKVLEFEAPGSVVSTLVMGDPWHWGSATASGTVRYTGPWTSAGAYSLNGAGLYHIENPEGAVDGSWSISGYGAMSEGPPVTVPGTVSDFYTSQNVRLAHDGGISEVTSIPANGYFDAANFDAAVFYDIEGDGFPDGTWQGTFDYTTEEPFDLFPTWAIWQGDRIEVEFQSIGLPLTAFGDRDAPVADVELYWASAPSTSAVIAPVADPVPVHWNQAGGAAEVTGITEVPDGAEYLLVWAWPEYRSGPKYELYVPLSVIVHDYAFKGYDFTVSGDYSGYFGTVDGESAQSGTVTLAGRIDYESPTRGAGTFAGQFTGGGAGGLPDPMDVTGTIGDAFGTMSVQVQFPDSAPETPGPVWWLTGPFDPSDFSAALDWRSAAFYNLDGTRGSWSGTFAPSSADPVDIVLPDVSWTIDGVMVEYGVTGPPIQATDHLTAATDVQLYWASGPTSGHVLGNALPEPGGGLPRALPVYWNLESATVELTELTEPPPEATHLLVIADGAGQVAEADETNNLLALPINHPPVAEPGGPYLLEMGQDLGLDASGSYDPDAGVGDAIAEYRWDLDLDGLYDDLVSTDPTVTVPWAHLAPYAEPGYPCPIGLEVVDTVGYADAAETTVTCYSSTPDLRALMATAQGDSTLLLGYLVTSLDVDPFEFGFYRSADGLFGPGDELLDSVLLSGPADLSLGWHEKMLPIGGGDGEIALPGAGAAESANDYCLVAVADPLDAIVEDDVDPLNEDNTAVFAGVYHPPGGGVFVHGTAASDAAVVSPGSLRLELNGTVYTYAGADVNGVRIRGHDGDDSFDFTYGAGFGAPAAVAFLVHGGAGENRAVLRGSSDAETATMEPGAARFQGPLFDVHVADASQITVYGEGGTDVAFLHGDPARPDYFKAWPDHAQRFGDGFFNEVHSFRYVHGYGTPGNVDVAYLYDEDGAADTFQAWPDMARLFGSNYYNRVKSFRYVHGYGTVGDTDVAYLYDNPGTADTFEAWPEMARLFGADYYNRVKSFRYVHGYGTTGNDDVAMLHDSTNNDVFQAWPSMARMYGGGFYNRVRSFRWVHGYSRAGGSDKAYLNDSPGNDRFDAWAGLARLYGGGFYNRALDFEQGQGIAQPRDDNDRANAYEATVWEALGDWEGGNMTPVPLSAEGREMSPSFEAVSAVLLEMYEQQRSASDDTQDHEKDAAVDWLLMESW